MLTNEKCYLLLVPVGAVEKVPVSWHVISSRNFPVSVTCPSVSQMYAIFETNSTGPVLSETKILHYLQSRPSVFIIIKVSHCFTE